MYANYVIITYIVVSYTSVLCEDYSSITCDGKRHTMTVYREGGGEECAGFTRGLTQQEESYLVQVHNELRDLVASGRGHPQAANMMKMIWSKEGARIAQRWADQCTFGEQLDDCRSLLSGERGGQIVASAGKEKIEDTFNFVRLAVTHWFISNRTLFDQKSVKSYRYDPRTFAYSQIVWAKSDRLGCGMSRGLLNGKVEHRFVCNYYLGGDVEGEPVYLEGKACSKCPFAKCSGDFRSLCEQQSGTVWNRDHSGGASVLSEYRVVFVIFVTKFCLLD